MKSVSKMAKLSDDEYEYGIFGFLVNNVHIVFTSPFCTEEKAYVIDNFIVSCLKYAKENGLFIPEEIATSFQKSIVPMSFATEVTGYPDDNRIRMIIDKSNNVEFTSFLLSLIGMISEKITQNEYFAILEITHRYCMLTENEVARKMFNAFLLRIVLECHLDNGVPIPITVMTDIIPLIDNLRTKDYERMSKDELVNWVLFLTEYNPTNRESVDDITKLKRRLKTLAEIP